MDLFDRAFFQAALPAHVAAIRSSHPDQTPVVQIHLADGTVLDVCHIIGLSDGWVGVAYFREPASCDEVDVAFLLYGTISRVTIALPHRSARAIGFGQADAAGAVPAAA